MTGADTNSQGDAGPVDAVQNHASSAPGNVHTATPLTEGAVGSGVNSPASGTGNQAAAELAFAVKIQGSLAPAASPADSGLMDDAALNQLVAAANPKAGGSFAALLGSEGKSGSGEAANDLALMSLAVPGAADTFTKSTPCTPDQPVAAVTEIPEAQPNSASLKTVQVQVTGADNQRVDLRIMERSGALTISVRSPDSSLTKALQQQLPELSHKLSNQQVRAEWWTPETPKVAPAQKGDGSFNDRNNQNKDSSGQQGGRGARQPDWVEELTDLRKSIQNGKQYTWHL